MLEVHVMSGVCVSRHYFPCMLKRSRGRVIFMSNEVDTFTPPDMVYSGISKSCKGVLFVIDLESRDKVVLSH